jgi:hypothetical protein
VGQASSKRTGLVQHWQVYPFDGLAALRFDAPQVTVRALLGPQFENALIQDFRDDQPLGLALQEDVYNELGLHLSYDSSELLASIEAFPPCNPIYQDIQFFSAQHLIAPRQEIFLPSDATLRQAERQQQGNHLQHVLTQLARKGHLVHHIGDEFRVPNLGLVLFVLQGTIQTISLYRRDTYPT